MPIIPYETGSQLLVGEDAQDPLPSDWQSSRWNQNDTPNNFRIVDAQRDLFASALVTPRHSHFLRRQNIKDVICFLPSVDHWADEEVVNSLNIHHFPIFRRKHLHEQVLTDVARLVISQDRPMIFHCLKGATRTGMFEQFWHIVSRDRLPAHAAVQSMRYGNFNASSFREMFGYAQHRDRLRQCLYG